MRKFSRKLTFADRYDDMVPFLILLLSLCTPLTIRAESCEELNSKIDQENTTLRQLLSQQKEVDEKFQRNVINDLITMAEGIFDKSHRDAAVKTAYARKRLQKSIDAHQATLKSVRDEFCSRCRNSAKNAAAKIIYCEKCPEKPEC